MTTGKRILIAIRAAPEAFQNGKYQVLDGLNFAQNAADSLTIQKQHEASDRILDTGVLQAKVKQWIERGTAVKGQCNSTSSNKIDTPNVNMEMNVT